MVGDWDFKVDDPRTGHPYASDSTYTVPMQYQSTQIAIRDLEAGGLPKPGPIREGDVIFQTGKTEGKFGYQKIQVKSFAQEWQFTNVSRTAVATYYFCLFVAGAAGYTHPPSAQDEREQLGWYSDQGASGLIVEVSPDKKARCQVIAQSVDANGLMPWVASAFGIVTVLGGKFVMKAYIRRMVLFNTVAAERNPTGWPGGRPAGFRWFLQFFPGVDLPALPFPIPVEEVGLTYADPEVPQDD